MSLSKKQWRILYTLGITLALVGIGVGVLLLMKSGVEEALPEKPIFEDPQESGHDHGHGSGDAQDL